MKRPTKRVPIAWWHSLMYAIGIVLIVCGIPATILISLMFRFAHDRSARLDSLQTLLFSGCMVGTELVLGVGLIFVAGRITKHRNKI